MKKIPKPVCALPSLLEVLSSKWTLMIFQKMVSGPVRTKDFLSSVPALSMKTLQERLRSLSKLGLIERKKYPEVPPRVEYSLSAKGRSILQLMSKLNAQVGDKKSSQCKCPFHQ